MFVASDAAGLFPGEDVPAGTSSGGSSARRFLEKWLYEGLSEEERDRVPPALLDRAGAHFRQLAETALCEVADGRVTDGPSAMRRLRRRIEEQR